LAVSRSQPSCQTLSRLRYRVVGSNAFGWGNCRDFPENLQLGEHRAKDRYPSGSRHNDHAALALNPELIYIVSQHAGCVIQPMS
jgi:hypothetical protein